uniref:hypothetical protein n=1 Tax=Mesomycoplasma ovipneumoniae TaxID=29562 RepID=UPI003080D7C3
IEAGEKGPSEEKETPAASSAEEKPADEPEVESEEQSSEEEAGDEPEKSEEVDTEDEPEGDKGDKSNDLSDGGEKPKKPKPVEGETPREYALRMEVERVKKANRILRGAKLLGDVQPQKATQSVEYSDEEKKILESFDPEQVSN